ncbi:hypothetical protein N9M66_03635 [Litoreibacter sp.]|nr:hypothetical protein [Litoreibacter sp.]
MYLRFVQSCPVEGMRARQGFFDAAYDLRRCPTSDPMTVERLRILLDWFDDHLDLPARFNKTKSKGYLHKETRGLSWFRPSAKEHLAKSFELSTILQVHGFPVELLKTNRPGFVVFEDEFQIVAEPFNDTPTR